MAKYYCILYASMLLAAGAQIMLKLGAVKSTVHSAFPRNILNPMVMKGLFLMAVSMLMNVKGLRHVPLKDMAFILPAVYIAVPFFSWIFLNERPGHRTVVGSIIMLIGIVIFNFPL